MVEGKRECGCTLKVGRPCQHMVLAVLNDETEHLTLDELERTEKFIERMKNNPRREELERHLPLPHPIQVVQGGSPESGKRK